MATTLVPWQKRALANREKGDRSVQKQAESDSKEVGYKVELWKRGMVSMGDLYIHSTDISEMTLGRIEQMARPALEGLVGEDAQEGIRTLVRQFMDSVTAMTGMASEQIIQYVAEAHYPGDPSYGQRFVRWLRRE